MNSLPRSIIKLIHEFQKLPGVGPKTAARMAYFYLKNSKTYLNNLSELLVEISKKVVKCKECSNYTDKEDGVCEICSDTSRNQDQIMIVEESLDLVSIEEAHIYFGKYHVLGGVISPVNGIGPEDLEIKLLKERISKNKSTQIEVIFALTPNLEGEATVSFIQKKLKDIDNLKFTILARGLSTGTDLDYVDSQTLSKAFDGRVPINVLD